MPSVSTMEPFKNQFNDGVIRKAAEHLDQSASALGLHFDAPGFVAAATEGLEALELKARSNHIAEALGQALPEPWSSAVDVLLGALRAPSDPDASASATVDDDGIGGFMIMALCETVVRRGRDEHAESMRALHGLTQRFSAEFAIRPFLDEQPDATLATLTRWIDDPSAHVRRLVSEGTRPRLPWGMRLRAFAADPTPTLALLDRLKDDPSEYVRRSVANHLGDIAKDHPDRAVAVAERWYSPDSNRQKLVKHGLRWLIKQGHPGALALLGYGEASVTATLRVEPAVATMGGFVMLDATITATGTAEQALLVDYAVHHVKADGSRSPKVFKWRTVELAPGKSSTARKKHSLKIVTTRRYYPGEHLVELLVNGKGVATATFELGEAQN